MALHLKADGESELIFGKDRGWISLEQLQEAVGGYVEQRSVGNNFMFMNEEGRLKGLPYNDDASKLAGIDIVGDAVFCLKNEVES